MKNAARRANSFVCRVFCCLDKHFRRVIIFNLIIIYSAFIRIFVKVFTRQQTRRRRHLKPVRRNKHPYLQIFVIIFITAVLFLSGCGSFVKVKDKNSPTLLKSENAAQSDLIDEINRFAAIRAMRAKMDLKFEDNSYAELGIAEKYRSADGEIVVERPAKILLKVQVPLIKTDVVQMTSDGEKFRVAILQDDAGGKNRNFVLGTNNADYTLLQEQLKKADFNGKAMKQNVNAFANMRPQHFTDAMLVRPVDAANFAYAQSSILQEEDDLTVAKKSPLKRVLRGYYLLDEYRKNVDGSLSISRRFWFDRVGAIRLARQQIFDEKGEIESDIIYGREAAITETGNHKLPLRIEVTRPKEKYKMSLTYQSAAGVEIDDTYPAEAFVLENRWNLPEVDLDRKLEEIRHRQPQSATGNNR